MAPAGNGDPGAELVKPARVQVTPAGSPVAEKEIVPRGDSGLLRG